MTHVATAATEQKPAGQQWPAGFFHLTAAAYGGMYIAVALLWLHFVDGVSLTRWDAAGAVLALAGMAVIALQPR